MNHEKSIEELAYVTKLPFLAHIILLAETITLYKGYLANNNFLDLPDR